MPFISAKFLCDTCVTLKALYMKRLRYKDLFLSFFPMHAHTHSLHNTNRHACTHARTHARTLLWRLNGFICSKIILTAEQNIQVAKMWRTRVKDPVVWPNYRNTSNNPKCTRGDRQSETETERERERDCVCVCCERERESVCVCVCVCVCMHWKETEE